jgi:methylated-DNA-[protein]-cysteine S-methyltransferase
VPLDLGALTPFQLDTCRALAGIGFGKVTTYGALAEELGVGAAGARAIGQAVGANPVAVVIPCHRVIGSDHTLHGYSGGLPRKAWLLRHEGIVVDGEDEHARVHPEELRLEL